jgi:hypothetical protein
MRKKQNELPEADRQKYQREIAELYRKYKLGRPQQITQQLNCFTYFAGGLFRKTT